MSQIINEISIRARQIAIQKVVFIFHECGNTVLSPSLKFLGRSSAVKNVCLCKILYKGSPFTERMLRSGSICFFLWYLNIQLQVIAYRRIELLRFLPIIHFLEPPDTVLLQLPFHYCSNKTLEQRKVTWSLLI